MAPDLSEFPDNDLHRYFLNNQSRDLHKWHHYFEIYEHWFSGYRDRKDLRMLEIGVFRGGSLRMWRGYFRPEAAIVGIDIDSRCKASQDPAKNIFVEIGDQGDSKFLREVVDRHGPFDIIVDDGGHTTAQQTVSFNALYGDGLKEGGIYLVEDLHTNYWPEFRNTDRTFVDYAKSLVDYLHEPYQQHHSISLFEPGNEQLHSVTVSQFCATTRSISFYDSVVVFEKRHRGMPISEIR